MTAERRRRSPSRHRPPGANLRLFFCAKKGAWALTQRCIYPPTQKTPTFGQGVNHTTLVEILSELLLFRVGGLIEKADFREGVYSDATGEELLCKRHTQGGREGKVVRNGSSFGRGVVANLRHRPPTLHFRASAPILYTTYLIVRHGRAEWRGALSLRIISRKQVEMQRF